VKLVAELDDLIKLIPEGSNLLTANMQAQALYRFAYKTFHQLS
jgi:hypothetical protein